MVATFRDVTFHYPDNAGKEAPVLMRHRVPQKQPDISANRIEVLYQLWARRFTGNADG